MSKKKCFALFSFFVLVIVLSIPILSLADTFTPRLTDPGTSRYWIHTSKGGLNECILISGDSVLPNCVGYAWGRAYEILGTRPTLSKGNATNWYGNTADGYRRGSTPQLGAIACWQGNSLNPYGHVAVVERIVGSDAYVSESEYGGARFRSSLTVAAHSSSYGNFVGYIYILNNTPVTNTPTPTTAITPTPVSTPTPTQPQTGNVYIEYFNGIQLSGNVVWSEYASNINKNWGTGSPGNGLSIDSFSARFTYSVSVFGGYYKFHYEVDDAIKIWVDGDCKLDRWDPHVLNEDTSPIYMSSGSHNIKVEYAEYTGDAKIYVSMSATSAPTPTPTAIPTPVVTPSTYTPGWGSDQNGHPCYYLDNKGTKVENYFSVNGKLYYAYPNTGIVVRTRGWFTRADGVKCYSFDDGWLTPARFTENENDYFVNYGGTLIANQYMNISGKYYYAGHDGIIKKFGFFTRTDDVLCFATGADGSIQMSSSLYSINSKVYYIQTAGVVAKNQYFIDSSNNLRYAQLNGTVITTRGWFVRADGVKCYAWDNGKIIPVRFTDTNGSDYYVNYGGTLIAGQYLNINSKLYYAGNDGEIKKQGYFLRDDGVLCYAAGSDGAITPTWIIYNGLSHYVNEAGNIL